MFGSVKFYAPLKFNFMTDSHMFFETRHGGIAFITLRALVRLSFCFWLCRRDALVLILPECAQYILQLLSCLELPSDVLGIVPGDSFEFAQEIGALLDQSGYRILRVHNGPNFFVSGTREMCWSPGYGSDLSGRHGLKGFLTSERNTRGKQSIDSRAQDSRAPNLVPGAIADNPRGIDGLPQLTVLSSGFLHAMCTSSGRCISVRNNSAKVFMIFLKWGPKGLHPFVET